jgi:hypothetical protein
MKQHHAQTLRFWTARMAPLRRFCRQTSGAVTVDWVVLTAALVAMVVAFMAGFTADIDGFLVVLMAGL